MKLTSAQLKKIWVLAREHHLEEEDLRNLVEQVSGSRSISSLTKSQAKQVIDRLSSPSGTTYRPYMATPNQIRKIRALERELGWNQNPKRLQAFMKKYCRGITRVEWLTTVDAHKLIESLKAVRNRERRKQRGDTT